MDCEGTVLGGKEFDLSGIENSEHCCDPRPCVNSQDSDCRIPNCGVCQTEAILTALRLNRWFPDTDEDGYAYGNYYSSESNVEGYCGVIGDDGTLGWTE